MKQFLLSLVLLFPISSHLIAQDTEEENEVEEVIVSGVKSSLKDAIDIKRKMLVSSMHLQRKILVNFQMETLLKLYQGWLE